MINWRCPRPTAVIASTALIPNSSGSLTGWRSTTVGACNSRARCALALIAPKPSIGFPSGSTVLPKNASPTGTSNTRPVRLTSCPSWIPEGSPKRTAPISETSKLRATPNSPPSNSSNSLVIADGKPSTRAIPSPVSATRPTSSLEVFGLKLATLRSIALRISSGLIWSSVIFDTAFLLFLYSALANFATAGSFWF